MDWMSVFDLRIPALLAFSFFAGICLFQHLKIYRRLDGQSRSIGHMDDCADTVEARFEELERKLGRAGDQPGTNELEARHVTPEQVQAIISQIGRASSSRRAA